VTGDSPTQRCLEGGSTSATVAGIAADDCAEHSFSDGSRARPGCFEHPIRDLRSFTTSDLLPQVGGRLQGLSPPTSPVRPGCVLQHPERLFLPWVCFPSEVLLPDRCLTLAGGASTSGLPQVHPGTGFHDARRCLRMTPKSVRTVARCRLFGWGGCVRCRARPPWGFSRQRATVTTSKVVASSREEFGSRRSFR